MHLLSLYQSCTNFMTLLNPRNCSTQHQPEEKTDKPSISKALCGWAGTWISIKQAIYILIDAPEIYSTTVPARWLARFFTMTCAACATLVEYTVCSWKRQSRLYQRQQTMDTSAHAILAWLCQHFQPSRDYFHLCAGWLMDPSDQHVKYTLCVSLGFLHIIYCWSHHKQRWIDFLSHFTQSLKTKERGSLKPRQYFCTRHFNSWSTGVESKLLHRVHSWFVTSTVSLRSLGCLAGRPVKYSTDFRHVFM